jgi:hypothetical protein
MEILYILKGQRGNRVANIKATVEDLKSSSWGDYIFLKKFSTLPLLHPSLYWKKIIYYTKLSQIVGYLQLSSYESY